jgi:hypothetical protein
MAGTLSPDPWLTFLDANGNPYVGAKLFTYLTGTSTKTTTYQDAALTSQNTNPIVLDAAGRCTVYLVSGIAYKFVLAPSTDTDPPIAAIKTTDPVNTVPTSASNLDTAGLVGSVGGGGTITAGQVVYCSDGGGGRTAGNWYKADSTNTYSSNAADLIGFATTSASIGTSVSVRIAGVVTGLSGLSSGTVYYIDTGGNITSTPPTNARAVGFCALGSTTLNILTETSLRNQQLFDRVPIFKPGTAATYDSVINGTLLASVDTTQHANAFPAETTLSTFSLTASTLSSNLKGIKVSAGGTYAANGNTKTLKFYFGGTAVTLYAAAQNGGSWHFFVYVIRTGAATQKIVGLYSGVSAAGVVVNTTVSTTAAETLSGAITVKTTGTSGTAASDILQEVFIPETVGA